MKNLTHKRPEKPTSLMLGNEKICSIVLIQIPLDNKKLKKKSKHWDKLMKKQKKASNKIPHVPKNERLNVVIY